MEWNDKVEQKVKWIYNQKARTEGIKEPTDFLSEKEIMKVRSFHQSFEQYEPTPLRSLTNLAAHLGVSGIFVKDEAYRFGLKAFKVLGGSYAIGRYLASRLNKDIKDLSFAQLKTTAIKKELGAITFTSATDGNHGRGVAWVAQQLGQKAVIYMPKGSAIQRLESIKATGAEAFITELNYDDAVKLAADKAQELGWVIVQDTSWEGYEEIPQWIMQGYGTMAYEAVEQLKDIGIEKPTHIFVQAGVGSMAGAVQGLFTDMYGSARPVTIVVEPDKADCIFRSAWAKDGNPHTVKGHMDTIMAGLACGEPSRHGWRLLRDYADMFISCPDYIAANGMRILGNPIREDARVISGESGAVTTGILQQIMQKEELQEIKHRLNLNKNSKILLFNTEGDTDTVGYRRIVWYGQNPDAAC